MQRRQRTVAPSGGRARRRRWTRTATVGMGAHVFYELGAGVGMPFASRIGPGPAAALWSTGTLLVARLAGRQPSSRDTAFLALDAGYLAAVLAHLTGWPRRRLAGVPWLVECEGLRGPVMPAYNLILYASAVAALGGLVENRRGSPAALAPLALVPWLIGVQHREHHRLLRQAEDHPGWWNRRLRAGHGAPVLPGGHGAGGAGYGLGSRPEHRRSDAWTPWSSTSTAP